MPVRIVVDSASGLPKDLAQELDITIVDLHKVSTTTKEGKEEVSTSGISALEFAAVYARQLERGGDEGVLALHLSGNFSATLSAASSAAGIFDGAVRVIDTQSVGMSIGKAAIAAAERAREGADLETCAKAAEDTLARCATWVYLHRVDDIRRSGRLSTGTAIMSAALLATRPIMRISEGKLELAGKTRTQSKAFSKLVSFVNELAQDQPVDVSIQHHESEEAAERLYELIEEALPEGSSISIVDFDPVLAVHAGPGAVGVTALYPHPIIESDEEEDE